MPARVSQQIRRTISEPLEARCLLAGFDFEFVYTVQGNIPAIHTAIEAAAARWKSILTADIPDADEGDWGAPIDDVRITVHGAHTDGPGKVLASASPMYRRPDTGLPLTGRVTMDLDDLSNPGLNDILTHELGHILGIGAAWSSMVSDLGGANPIFTGPHALAEYRALAGDLNLAGVPVENTGNPGTRDVHWREATFANELMTGFYNSSVIDPLSRMSAAALIDLGFPGVSLEGADPYNLPNGNPIPTIGSLTAATGSVGVGGSFALTASTVLDAGRASDGAGAGVAKVRFYRESNGIAGLQATGNLANPDTLVETISAGPWQTAFDTAGLAAGSYTFYAQAVDVLGATSATASVQQIIALLPPTPAKPVLDAADDRGASNSDGITNVAKPLLRGSIEGASTGTVVDVFADGVAIGQATVSDGAWSFVPATPLSDGGHAITAIARFGGVSGPASAVLNIVIDTLAPHATVARFEFATRLGVAVDFDENVAASLDPGDLDVLNTTTGSQTRATLNTSTASSAFFALSPLALSAGDYVATLGGAGVTDVAGNALAAPAGVSFFFLPGDVDRSRRVDATDLSILAQHYNRPGTALDGDLDYSGFIDFDDLVILAQHYGDALVTVAPLTTAPVKRRARAAADVLS